MPPRLGEVPKPLRGVALEEARKSVEDAEQQIADVMNLADKLLRNDRGSEASNVIKEFELPLPE